MSSRCIKSSQSFSQRLRTVRLIRKPRRFSKKLTNYRMKLIKSLLAASGALCLSLMPASARVESNTGELMRLVHSYGVNVQTFAGRSNCDGAMGRFSVENGSVQCKSVIPELPLRQKTTIRYAMKHGITSSGVRTLMRFHYFLS